RYLEMRRRLVRYFDRRNCKSPDELADETLNRVARRLEEADAVIDGPPGRYCYILAKFVFLEYLREAETRSEYINAASTELQSALAAPYKPDVAEEDRQRSLDCLDHCLEKLSAADRQLILEYYRGERLAKIENRRDLGTRLGLSTNALTIRACRIRNKLEHCVKTCLNKG